MGFLLRKHNRLYAAHTLRLSGRTLTATLLLSAAVHAQPANTAPAQAPSAAPTTPSTPAEAPEKPQAPEAPDTAKPPETPADTPTNDKAPENQGVKQPGTAEFPDAQDSNKPETAAAPEAPPPVVPTEEVSEEKALSAEAPKEPEKQEEPKQEESASSSASAAASATTQAAEATAPEAPTSPPQLTEDELAKPGYVPGYRRHVGVGLSPYVPRIGTRPGGMTSGYGSPTAEPPGGWNFRWNGFMTSSLQFTINERPDPKNGQTKLVYHTPPRSIDEYWSFLSTQAMPNNWIQMNFRYGSEHVEAIAQITTWMPTRATNYYQMGSQQFINRVYLQFKAPTIAGIRLRWKVGYFPNRYGNVGQYGNGIYTTPVIGQIIGVGETATAEYDITDNLALIAEHGFLGQRAGKPPIGVVPETVNGFIDPQHPADWVHHAHLGFVAKGDPEYRFNAHYISNFAYDDTTQLAADAPFTRDVDESHIKDAKVDLYGFDFMAYSSIWGRLGIAGSYLNGKNSTSLTTFQSVGGNGVWLMERYWGESTSGTGKLFAVGANYSFSLGTILSYPTPFSTGPDLLVQIAGQAIAGYTDNQKLDKRLRHKYGTDVLYVMTKNLGIGFRVDRVVPNSKDDLETFHTIAPRLQFKTSWNSRETVMLKYVKWWYGKHTRSGGINGLLPDRLDDQLVALNFSMWW